MQELKAYENNLDYCSDVAFLISVYYTKRNEHKSAINYVLSMIHKFPVNAKLRTLYVNLVLTGPKMERINLSESSGRIAESVLALTHSELLRRWVVAIYGYYELT